MSAGISTFSRLLGFIGPVPPPLFISLYSVMIEFKKPSPHQMMKAGFKASH